MRVSTHIKAFLILILGLFFSITSFGESTAQPLRFNMPRGVTPISRDIYYLHMTIFWISVVIGAIVFAVLIYSMIKHRKSIGHEPAKFHSSIRVEVIWAIIPFLILFIMAIPATIVLIRMGDEAKADINIKITGYQWKWKYDYLDQNISFFSNLSTPPDQISGKAKKGKWYLLEVDKPLVLPIHKKIRFLVTSNDVIHSWWVPALGVKRDAIPGYIHESWAWIEKPGVYRGQCAELCGLRHAFMPIVVVAKTEADFNQWVAKHKPQPSGEVTTVKTLTKEELMQEGKKIYTSTCSVCHKDDGSGMPPAFPALKGDATTTGPVSAHIDIVLNGKSGTAMQAFKNQLSTEQIAAVITYERNSWGNDDQNKYGKNAGGLVQPADILKAQGIAVAKEPPSTAPKTDQTTTPEKTPTQAPSSQTQKQTQTQTQTTSETPKEMTKEALMTEGKKIYASTCSMCHQDNGAGMPPAFPALKGSAIATGPVNAHINIVLNGKSGTTMQAFKNQLSTEQIAAVITYERNSWDNDDQNKYGKNAGGIVQPADVEKEKNKG